MFIADNRTVPSADPASVKKLWEFMHEAQATYGNGEIAVDTICRDCGFEPDEFQTVSYRLGILARVQRVPEVAKFLARWIHGGKPDDALFRAFALVPLRGYHPNLREKRLPFDAAELEGLLREDAEKSVRRF
jgi:hypothetical protein